MRELDGDDTNVDAGRASGSTISSVDVHEMGHALNHGQELDFPFPTSPSLVKGKEIEEGICRGFHDHDAERQSKAKQKTLLFFFEVSDLV